MIYGSEFIVEMKAGQNIARGEKVCVLEYIDGSNIDDEAAYRAKSHPGGKVIGVCLKGKSEGKYILVEFYEHMDAKTSVLLFTLKKQMFLRWLAETYPGRPAIPKIPRSEEPEAVDAMFADAMLNEAMASAELSNTPIEGGE